MALRDEIDYTYVDISRSVTGMGDFMNHARHHGGAIFSHDNTSTIIEPGTQTEGYQPDDPDDQLGPDILTLTTTGAPRLKLYEEDEVRLTLLHRRQPQDLPRTSRLRSAGTKLTRLNEAVYRSIDGASHRTSNLYGALTRVGLKYDVPSQEAVPITFRAVALNPDPEFDGKKGVEIGLVPAPFDPATLMSVEQARLCYDSLGNEARGLNYPSDGTVPLIVPFARLPKDVQPRELEYFCDKLEEMLPVRGIMGAFKSRPTVHN